MLFGPKCQLLTVIKISPRIVRFDDQVFVVQNSKSVDNVCAKIAIDVFWKVLSNALSIPRPVSEVADYLEVTCKRTHPN